MSPSGPEVLILEHDPKERSGTIAAWLEREKIPYRRARLFERVSFPEPESLRAVVVMGGPMNVYEEEKHPFLKAENDFIRRAVDARVPYLGVCLGSQLLAKALGARVYKAAKPEVGWMDVDLSPAAARDAFFGGVRSKKLKVFQWHEDTFDLPPGAVHLASSPDVPNQAYAVDGLFWGLQFHVEVDRPLLEDWFRDKDSLGAILGAYDAYAPELTGLTGAMYRSFFSLSARPSVLS
ncbi:MAG TPA: type 1 glutamine amidotransferase [Candidatus Eisenbacteria bacterium]|nr:type 1 glutamine amidotransferase [Candidatus Eisenbacteria bacterium]